jgi:enamine deaminase RidA (YjgF/YER057c/UK114 family)
MKDATHHPSSRLEVLLPKGWPRPKGFSNGMAGRGRVVLVGGQIGWDEQGRFAKGLADQTAQALRNILAVVAEAGGGPGHIARLTWYVTDMDAYRGQQAEMGAVYRKVMGRHFPAMALVEVRRLVEPEALVEIEATAIVPE